MKKINFGARQSDLDNIAIGMYLYPYSENTTDAIRIALAERIKNADPVQLAEARKAVLKNNRAAGVAFLQARKAAAK